MDDTHATPGDFPNQGTPDEPALDATEDAERRAEVYAQSDRSLVAVIDGFGTRVTVERGHLELRDGVGEHRRLRRYSKVDPPRRVVVGIGTVGTLSLDALRWCAQVSTPVLVLGIDGAVLTTAPAGREDARLLRAQALALYGPSGVAVTRYLIAEKVRGQAHVLGLRLDAHDAVSTLLDLLVEIEVCDSIEEIRQREAACANVYFGIWEQLVEASFVRKDVARIPAHWLRFNGRRSSVNPGSARSATDPAGALLNYGYRLAEIEATLAARRIGLEPSVGILHADMPGRPSLACDLMEAVRPMVDAHVLDILGGPLRKREFTEDARGVVRCLAPITHRLAEAMPSYAVALGPVTEHVANLLATASPYDVRVPTVLSGSKHKEAARVRTARSQRSDLPSVTGRGPSPKGTPPRGRRRPKPSASPPLPLRACRGCGAALPVDPDRERPRIDWCPDCLPARREELAAGLPAKARAAVEETATLTGTLATHTPEARVARAEGNLRRREEQRIWAAAASPDSVPDASWFEELVRPRLATVSLPNIARAAGVSTSAASKWRAGRSLPHARHWRALAELVGEPWPPG